MFVDDLLISIPIGYRDMTFVGVHKCIALLSFCLQGELVKINLRTQGTVIRLERLVQLTALLSSLKVACANYFLDTPAY